MDRERPVERGRATAGARVREGVCLQASEREKMKDERKKRAMAGGLIVKPAASPVP